MWNWGKKNRVDTGGKTGMDTGEQTEVETEKEKERIQSYDTRVGTAEFELGGNGSKQG